VRASFARAFTSPGATLYEADSRLNELSRPRRGAASTSQGHPRTIFRRALEHDKLVLAEVTAREIGRVQRATERACREVVSRQGKSSLLLFF
jgi:hypothetical protein